MLPPNNGVCFTLFLSVLWMCMSVGMINFNKFMMSGPFPHPEVLVALHMASGFLFAVVLMLHKRDLFPSLGGVQADPGGTFCRLLPISVFFATSLWMANMAYKYCSVALLQMMKEGNIPFVYAVSLMVGLERFEAGQAALAMLVFMGAILATASAAMAFAAWQGVVIQVIAQVAECVKTVIQAKLLTGAGGSVKLDAMTMVLCLSPITLVCLVPVVCFRFEPIVWSRISECKMLLLANCGLAFSLNCVAMVFMAQVSAVGFVLAGSLKAVFVVILGIVTWNEPTTHIQIAGFMIEIVCIAQYSLRKRRISGQAKETLPLNNKANTAGL